MLKSLTSVFVAIFLLTSLIAFSANVVTVTVNAAAILKTLPNTAFGLNVAVWDRPTLLNKKLPLLLKALNVDILRYPGGSTSDKYDWKSNSMVTGWHLYPQENNFDNFMKLVHEIDAQALITVNYGTGSPKKAAAWVKYANVEHNYNVKYWEIGNEVYGDGFYGPDWESDFHKLKGPQAYAENFIKYAKAMKAIDPDIKIGAVLTCPYTKMWHPSWNETVLRMAGKYMDFVVIHWYAVKGKKVTDSAILNSTDKIPRILAQLKADIRKFAGSSENGIQIFITETNSTLHNGLPTTTLVNALFLVNDYMSWLQGGAMNVDWWDLYNRGAVGKTTVKLYGNPKYGDFALLSNGLVKGKNVNVLPVNTPFPDYYGYMMLKYFVKPGDDMIGSYSSCKTLNVYASKRSNERVALMIVNTSPNISYKVQLKFEGFEPQSIAQEYTYGMGNGVGGAMTSIDKKDISLSTPLEVRPYSINVVVIKSQRIIKIFGPQVFQTTRVERSTISPKQIETVQANFTNRFGTLPNAVIVLEIYNSSGQMVGQKIVKNVNLNVNQPYTVVWDWKAPNVTDTYTVKSFVFGRYMIRTFSSSNNAAKFVVEK